MTKIAATSVLVAVCLLFVGCDSTFKAGKLNEQRRFETIYKVKPDEIVIAKPFESRYRDRVFIRFGAEDLMAKKYTNFYAESFRNMGIFSKVDLKQDLEQFVIKQNLSAKVPNVNDLISLNNLAKEIGPFLIVEPSAEQAVDGRYKYICHLKAIDPITGQTVFQVSREQQIWSGLDQQLLYPPMNTFMDWAEGKLQTKVTSAQDSR